MPEIPMMFRAQIKDRGKIQYAGDPRPATQWVDEWLEGCPPIPEPEDESIPVWKRQTSKSTVKMPEFGDRVKTQDYQIRWRLVTNSGQDEGTIRPVIGAKGLPFFPGSSMKGAFLRACPPEKRMTYCGGEIIEKGEIRTKPGILRFHGGYPIDMTWGSDRGRLVDLVHAQQPYQVMKSDAGHTANVQISLYKPQFRFGISSSRLADTDPEWERIWEIWEDALSQGIGSRVSAGYGYVDRINADGSRSRIEHRERSLFSVHLKGRGLTPELLTRDDKKRKISEFRPNLFKAVLRGHTLRLLGGITGEQNDRSPAVAEILTQKLWGGIDGGAIVGLVKTDFQFEEQSFAHSLHQYKAQDKTDRTKQYTVFMPMFELQTGTLELLAVKDIEPKDKAFLRQLIKFSLLLGGFGKSWRRVNHHLFYPDYFKNGDKAAIGCHWELLPESEQFYVRTNNTDLRNIAQFLQKTRDCAIEWLRSEGYEPEGYMRTWREAWHPHNVQVWGRIAKNQKDSQAVYWFHDTNILKNSSLAGGLGRIGRIWHRMYPRYVKTHEGEVMRYKDEYIELLTIFPDRSQETIRFMNFIRQQVDLNDKSRFRLLWGGEN